MSWDHNFGLEEVRVVGNCLKERPDVLQKVESLKNLALDIVRAGMRECGWTAWEQSQKAIVPAGSECQQATTYEDFFGASGSNSDPARNSRKRQYGEHFDAACVKRQF